MLIMLKRSFKTETLSLSLSLIVFCVSEHAKLQGWRRTAKPSPIAFACIARKPRSTPEGREKAEPPSPGELV